MHEGDSKCVKTMILMLNDWIWCLGLRLRETAGSPLTTLCMVETHPTCTYLDMLVPVTDDQKDILLMLGFRDNACDAILGFTNTKYTSTKRICALMCKSPLFSPFMARNTAPRKSIFPCDSKLYTYARELPGFKEKNEWSPEETELVNGRKLALSSKLDTAFHTRARVVAMCEQYAMLKEVSLRTEDATEENPYMPNHERWKRFISLHGLLTLHAMPADGATELWKAFLNDPSRHSDDWICLD
jgi:hypothetical protein